MVVQYPELPCTVAYKVKQNEYFLVANGPTGFNAFSLAAHQILPPPFFFTKLRIYVLYT